MTNTYKILILAVLLIGIALLASCGILNGLLGSSGAAPGANTPAAQAAAQAADVSIWNWIGNLIGISPQTAQNTTMLTAGAMLKPAASKVTKAVKHVHKIVTAASPPSQPA